MLDINCVQIGTVQSFDAETQTATIQLAMKHVIDVDPITKEKVLQERPLLVACPVLFLSGGSGAITMPVAAGDTCVVLFCDRDFENWYTSGGVQIPITDRAHDLSDGIAIVGIRNSLNALGGYSTNSIDIRYGTTTLSIGSTGISSNKPITAPTVNSTGGATGTFNIVNVVNGVVISGS